MRTIKQLESSFSPISLWKCGYTDNNNKRKIQCSVSIKKQKPYLHEPLQCLENQDQGVREHSIKSRLSANLRWQPHWQGLVDLGDHAKLLTNTPSCYGFCFGPWGQSILLAWTDPQFTFVWRLSKSEKSALSSLSPLYISANLLRNKRLCFVVCDWWISICFVCFWVQVSLFDFEKHKSFTLALTFFGLLFTETWQIKIPKGKLFL